MVVSDRPVTLSTPEGQGKPGVGLTLSYIPPNHMLWNFKLCCREPHSRGKGCQMGGQQEGGGLTPSWSCRCCGTGSLSDSGSG